MNRLYIMQTITVIIILAMGYMLVLSLEHGTLMDSALFVVVIGLNWHSYKHTRARIRTQRNQP